MKHPRARTKQKRLKPRPQNGTTQNMNKSPQGIKTSVSGKHFKPRLELIRMRPRRASNHCKHRQPQTSENHEHNRLKAASNAPERLKIISNYTKHEQDCFKPASIRLAAKHLPKPQPAGQPINQLTPAQSNNQSINQETTPSTNKPTPTNQPTNQATNPSTDRPTDRPTSQPTDRPTDQPASPADLRRALATPLSQHPENKRPAAFQNSSHFPLPETRSTTCSKNRNL